MRSVLEALLFGVSYGFAAAVQPGPMQAFLLTRVSQYGWRRTLPAAFAPLVSDAPIATLAILASAALTGLAARGLRGAGGVLLLWFAWKAWNASRRPAAVETAGGKVPRTLLEAAVVNLLNPNPWLGWFLILGPAALRMWRLSPAAGIALVGSFYTVLVAGLAGFIAIVGAGSSLLSPERRQKLIVVSALLLAAIGVWQVVAAAAG
ncbi:MAG: LysE family transporter [Acidobacteria bacterium]|nr:LysE family transporter [Acidobacteriota bacterium]